MLFGNGDLAQSPGEPEGTRISPHLYNLRREFKSGGKFFIPICCNPLKRLNPEK
jgi:hypothetical protein